MTKRTITLWFSFSTAVLLGLGFIGVVISANDRTEGRVVFQTYKDLLPIIIAIIASWLGFCIQRRSAYLQQLRSLWSKLVEAIQLAHQYTHRNAPTQEDFSATLLKLSIAIDEIRGVFCNIAEETDHPLYPFEPLKSIHDLIFQLGFGENFRLDRREIVRKDIFALWKEARTQILKEFDREVPTWPSSPWLDCNGKPKSSKVTSDVNM